MIKKTFLVTLTILTSIIFSNLALAANNQAADYLCEIGESFYSAGRYDEALIEFKKVILIDPTNKKASQYIDTISGKKEERNVSIDKALVSLSATPTSANDFSREAIMEQAILSQKTAPAYQYQEEQPKKKSKEKLQLLGMKVTGNTQLSLGADTRDTLWKRANFDLNENNYRTLSYNALDNGFNTFDPYIFDRLKVNLDTDNKEGFGLHSDITVDPWSFTGKGPKTTITSDFGDTADVELKYWSNSGYVIGEKVLTTKLGNSFSIPELKVKNQEAKSFIAAGAFSPTDSFRVSDTKIPLNFNPVRELWFDYKNDNFNINFFPLAYQTKAFTTDDPLTLSNNHIWWEPSPWLRSWRRGIYNYGVATPDFTKGYWDDSLASYTKDSDGTFLTALRGVSFTIASEEKTSLSSTIATPKGLWQDYSEVDNIISANRFKHYFDSNLLLGATYTSRTGFNMDDRGKTDSRNHVIAVDSAYEITEGTKIALEAATSRSDYDLTNSQYKTESRGNAFYFTVINRYPQKSIIDSSYDSLNLGKKEDFMFKSRIFGAHMDEEFDPTLSTYRQTRDDTFWSRHIHFRRPLGYYSGGLYTSSMSWDDIKPFGIGSGVDTGRDALGLRLEAIWKNKFSNLFDVRNVHDVNGKFIENTARDEATWEVNDRLTAKVLGIYQKMPKTKAGIDPFMTDATTNRYLTNSAIKDAEDCSLKTGSLGLEYDLTDWAAINGVWEHTNDYTLAYDNFPRGALNSANRSYLYTQNANAYRDTSNWLYDQGLFPNPPYSYYDIYKTGLRLNPMDNLEVYLDYTRNEFESAGQISDDMNHFGFETGYTPIKKLGFYFRYVYSRWQDLDRLRSGITSPRGHHNFFSEIRYLPTKDEELVLKYGEAGYLPIEGMSSDPFGEGLSTIDTQHIIRLYYRRKF